MPKIDSSGHTLGFIRLEQLSCVRGNAFVNTYNRVANIEGRIEELTRIFMQHKLQNEFIVPVKIIIHESLEPKWKSQEPKVDLYTRDPIGFTFNNCFYHIYS